MRADVPFEFASPVHPLIVVPARIDDRGPYRFVLDTGAGHTLLVPNVAIALGLNGGDEREGLGAGGKVRLTMTRVASLAVGTVRVRHLEVGITDELSMLSAAVGSRFDGDLGYNFLKEFRVTVDYPAHVLHLARPGDGDHHTEPAPGEDIPFHLASLAKPLVLVDTLVNKRGPVRFIVDTGASTTVVSAALASQLGLDPQPAPALTGGGGAVRATMARLDSLTVGRATVPSVTVAVTDFLSPLSEAVGAQLEGVVGYNFLKEFRVTIDYPRGVLRLS